MRFLFWLALGGLLYVSLYPWQFHFDRPLRWVPYYAARTPREVMDCVVNLACYLPIGFLGALAYSRGKRIPWQVIALVTAFGTAVSYGVELLQLFLPRYPNVRDVIYNGLGTFLGAVATTRLRTARWSGLKLETAIVILVFSWICWHGYPFTPDFSGNRLAEALRDLAHLRFGYFQFLIHACGMLLLVCVIRQSARIPEWAGWVAALVVPLQAVLDVPKAMHTLGTFAGLSLALIPGTRESRAAAANSIIGLTLVLIEPLIPFRWQPRVRSPLNWMPFQGVFEFYQGEYLRALFGRFFFIGAALFLCVRAGVRFPLAVTAVAGAVLVSTLMQIGLPNRQPDVTDLLLVVAAAAVVRISGR